MGESNTVVSAYTTYRHLQQYCSHPLHVFEKKKKKPSLLLTLCHTIWTCNGPNKEGFLKHCREKKRKC